MIFKWDSFLFSSIPYLFLTSFIVRTMTSNNHQHTHSFASSTIYSNILKITSTTYICFISCTQKLVHNKCSLHFSFLHWTVYPGNLLCINPKWYFSMSFKASLYPFWEYSQVYSTSLLYLVIYVVSNILSFQIMLQWMTSCMWVFIIL